MERDSNTPPGGKASRKMISEWRDNPCYYASMVDAGKVKLIAGPYYTHAEALNVVSLAHEWAVSVNEWFHFWAHGTVKLSTGQEMSAAEKAVKHGIKLEFAATS